MDTVKKIADGYDYDGPRVQLLQMTLTDLQGMIIKLRWGILGVCILQGHC